MHKIFIFALSALIATVLLCQCLSSVPLIAGENARVAQIQGNLTPQGTVQNVTAAPAARVQVGSPIPDFAFENLDDSTKKIGPKSLRGSWVLIDNWATWCGPCVREMEALHKAYTSFRTKKFIILSVSFDRQKSDVARFRGDTWHMPWLHCYSPGVWQNDAVKIMGIQSIPKPILIDPNGIVVAMDVELRGENLERTLAKFVQ